MKIEADTRTGTSEMLDRYGHYGEPMEIHDLPVRYSTDGTGHCVTMERPDGRETIEYVGQNGAKAEETFELLCASRVPEIYRNGRE